MAEAVRRFRETGGSDVVRRMLTQPIRFDRQDHPARKGAAAPPGRIAHAAADPSEIETAEPDDGRAMEPASEAAIGRLRAEMAVMKAILMAERAEAAVLRARIQSEDQAETLGDEARAVRDRWAGVVDRILLSAR